MSSLHNEFHVMYCYCLASYYMGSIICYISDGQGAAGFQGQPFHLCSFSSFR